MIAAITFEFPLGWLFGVPSALVLAFAAWRQHRRGLSAARILGLAALRGLALLVLVFLVARPIWIAKEPRAPASRSVALLVDRSESMSIQDQDRTRYDQA